MKVSRSGRTAAAGAAAEPAGVGVANVAARLASPAVRDSHAAAEFLRLGRGSGATAFHDSRASWHQTGAEGATAAEASQSTCTRRAGISPDVVPKQGDRKANPARYNKPKRPSAETDARSEAAGRSPAATLAPEREKRPRMNRSKGGGRTSTRTRLWAASPASGA